MTFAPNFNLGNAIGRYQLSGFFPDGYVERRERSGLPKPKSAYAAYRHFWSPTLRSSLILSASGTDTPGAGHSTLQQVGPLGARQFDL